MSYPTPQPGRRNTRRIWIGVVVLVVGVIGGGALLALSGSSSEKAAENLARAPIGCTTTLDFDKAGTFTIFVETKGSIGKVRGDCDNTDTDYDFGKGQPDVTLTLLDRNDDEVDFDDDESKSYDVGGFTGESIATVDIDEPGPHTLTVESQDEDFAIAVGKNPQDAAATMGLIGLAAVAIGVILGVLLIVLGLRRKPAAPSGGAPMGSAPFPAATMAGPSGYTPAPGYGAPPPPPPPYSPPVDPHPPATPSGPQWSPPSA